MVVTDTDEQRLKSVIDAYTEQTYGNWQLCLADACEGEETGEFLRKKYKKEIRLSYKKVTENNASFGYNADGIVSSDIIGTTFGSVFDPTQTQVVGEGDGQVVKVVAWYDNEWGYSMRIIDLVAYVASKGL